MNKKTSKFYSWLKKLYTSGKTDYEIRKLLTGVAKNSRIHIYEAIMTTLSKQEIKKLEKISNDEKLKQSIKEVFKKRYGMNINELIREVQEYLLT